MASEHGSSVKACQAASELMRRIERHITPDGDGYYPEDRCEEMRTKLYWELLSQEKERNLEEAEADACYVTTDRGSK
jgi:hypothetical protein